MERENRYIVIKREDVGDTLTEEGQRQLDQLLGYINAIRKQNGKKANKKYVVVSEDWPMYEQTWKAIEEWVDGGASSQMNGSASVDEVRAFKEWYDAVWRGDDPDKPIPTAGEDGHKEYMEGYTIGLSAWVTRAGWK